jgi:hypothetical protein
MSGSKVQRITFSRWTLKSGPRSMKASSFSMLLSVIFSSSSASRWELLRLRVTRLLWHALRGFLEVSIAAMVIRTYQLKLSVRCSAAVKTLLSGVALTNQSPGNRDWKMVGSSPAGTVRRKSATAPKMDMIAGHGLEFDRNRERFLRRKRTTGCSLVARWVVRGLDDG